jgi:PAS domain S-box-containing protein
VTIFTQKVLFIDDSLENQLIYRCYLLPNKPNTYRIIEAQTGEEALLLCQRQLPDAILLNYRLPDINGLEFLNRLKTQSGRTHLPVIIIEEQGSVERAVQAIKSGASEYLVKENLTPESLCLAIEKVASESGIPTEEFLGKTGKELGFDADACDVFEAACHQAIATKKVTREDITARKQTESELQEREAFLNSIYNGTEQAIFAIDVTEEGEFYYVHFNQVAERYADVTSEQIQGKTPEKAFGKELGATIRQNYNCCLQAGTSIHYEEQLAFEGHTIWTLTTLSPIRNEQGRIYRIVGTAVDISDRKLIEAQLRESEEKFRILVTHAPVGIFQTDPQGDCLFVNHKWSELTGLSLDRAMGKGWLDAIHSEDRERVFQEWYDAAQAKREFFLEYRFQTPQGKVNWVVGSAVAIRNRDGVVTGYFGTVTDISDRKRAEQKIREQAALLDIASDAIFVRDLEHQILFWNSGAEQLYGWTTAEVIDKKANELLCQKIRPEMEQIFKTVLESGFWQGELQKVTKSGKEVIVNSRMTLVRDEAGNPKSILTVDTDITEKKQLEKQFYQAQRLESLGTLASGIAHDLNNILTPILAVAQLLPIKLPNLERQNRRLLEILTDNAKRGAELVKQILSFARGEEEEKVLLQPKYAIEETERIIKVTFPKLIAIHTNIPKQNLGTISANPTQIAQVLMNLCVNARDAMPNGGTLTIAVENFSVDENYARMNLAAKVGNYVAITVSDTGCGIPEAIKERIFDPFFTTKEVGKGTGLGLATAIGIVKKHGGFVNVKSEVGKGSQFQVCLPASDTAATQVDSE